ncbi:MAG: four helix bundle protein [Chitinophagaceae bacterium]
MKESNIILEKTFALGLRIIKLFKHLRENKVERDLCLQLLRSGTSVGANVEEAMGGSSRKDFIHKLEIGYKEARETKYWIRLLKEASLLETSLADSFIKDIEEILKILTAILKSSRP